jgi:hypothetical protein
MGKRDLVLAVVPKIGASLSIPCSMFIISESIQDHRQGKGTAIQRALVGMSVVDICASSAWWLSNWGVPRETGAYATGSQATCSKFLFLSVTETSRRHHHIKSVPLFSQCYVP